VISPTQIIGVGISVIGRSGTVVDIVDLVTSILGK